MRILQIANFDRKNNLRYFYNCDFKIFNGLVREGHAVYQFSDRDVAKELSPFKSRFGGKSRTNKKLIDIFKTLMPDLIVAGHIAIIGNETLKELLEIKPDLKIIFFNVDPLFVPEYQRNVDYLNSLTDIADGIFITTAQADLLKQFSGKKAKIGFMPNPFDSSIDSGRVFENNKPKYDVFFAGGWPYRHSLMDKIESEVPSASVFRCGLTNEHRIFGNQYTKTLNDSRMGMNFPHGKEEKFTPYLYSSDRISHYIGNGLLTFMDKKTGYDDYFNDEELVFYSSAEELIEKIKFFRSNDELARKFASNAWKKGHEYYNSALIVRYMIEIVHGQKPSHNYQWPTEVY